MSHCKEKNQAKSIRKIYETRFEVDERSTIFPWDWFVAGWIEAATRALKGTKRARSYFQRTENKRVDISN